MIFYQITFFELNAYKDITGKNAGKKQMTYRHIGCDPEKQQKSKDERMAYIYRNL